MLGVLEQEACAVGGSVCPRHVENVEGVRLPVEVPLPWLSPGHQGVVQADPESGHDQCALRPCKAAGGLDSMHVSAAAERQEVGTDDFLDGLLRESVSAVLSKANSPVWSDRAAACCGLSAILQSRRQSELESIFDKAVSTLHGCLSDPHHRVVHAALCGVASMISVSPPSSTTLECLLPQLLFYAQEPRNDIREIAHGSLKAVEMAYTADGVLPFVLRAMDDSTPRIRVSALTFMSKCLHVAPQYAASALNIRACAAKLCACAADKTPEMRHAALVALHSLHSIGHTYFIGQVALLPLSSQTLIKQLLLSRSPSIELEPEVAELTRQPHAAAWADVAVPQTDVPKGERTPGQTPSPNHFVPHAALPSSAPSRSFELAGLPQYNDRQRSGSRACRHAPQIEPHAKQAKQKHTSKYAVAGHGDSEFRGRLDAPRGSTHITSPDGPLGHPLIVATPALLTPGAEDWLALMPLLLRQMAGSAAPQQQRDALLKLQRMTLSMPPEAPVWSAHFEHALEAILRSLQHTDDALRECGMTCTKDFIRAQPQRFRAFTEHVLLRLLAAGRDSTREVATAAEETIAILLSVSDAHRCMAVLVPVVMKESPPTLQLAVRMQSKLVARFSQLQLLSILPQVLPPLFEAFKNPNADVRKAVVFCLVDMFMVLGEQLTPHLAVLSTSQLKLVTIYINRTSKAKSTPEVGVT